MFLDGRSSETWDQLSWVFGTTRAPCKNMEQKLGGVFDVEHSHSPGQTQVEDGKHSKHQPTILIYQHQLYEKYSMEEMPTVQHLVQCSQNST